MRTRVLPETPGTPENAALPTSDEVEGTIRVDFAGRRVRVWPPARPASRLRWLAYPVLAFLTIVVLCGWFGFESVPDYTRKVNESPLRWNLGWLALGLMMLWPIALAYKVARDPLKMLVLTAPTVLGWLYALKLLLDPKIREVVSNETSAGTFLTLWPVAFAAHLALCLVRYRVEGTGRYEGTLPVADILARPSWGRPGLGHAGVETFGRSADIGSTGERVTATALSRLLENVPEARIFHGLRFPGSDVADVDHAVALGDNLFLIDSKRWKNASYSWGEWGQVLRDGAEFDGGNVHMDAAVEGFYRQLSQFRPVTRVYAFVLVVPDVETGRPSEVIGDSWYGNVSLRTSPEELVAAMLYLTDQSEQTAKKKTDRSIGGRFLNLRVVDVVYAGLIDRI